MAQAGVYAPSEVIGAEATIRVNGVVREHVLVDFAADTPGGLPEQVVSAGTGIRSRTGTIQWAHGQSVQTGPEHPLRRVNGWPPREGDRVQIDATVDTGQGPYTYRRFTGRIGRTSGSLVDGVLTSEIIDTFGDRLQEVLTVAPMARIPNAVIRSSYPAAIAMEAAGFGTVPPPAEKREGETILHQVFQGGSQATVGGRNFLMDGWDEQGDSAQLSAWTGIATLADDTIPRSSRDILVVARGPERPAWDPMARVVFTSGLWVRMTIHKAQGKISIASSTGFSAYYDRTDSWGIPMLAFRIRPGGLSVWDGPDRTFTVPEVVVGASDTVSSVNGNYLTGLEVRYLAPGANGQPVINRVPELPAQWARSNIQREMLPATRTLQNVTARHVIDRWSDSTLTSVWPDEYGRPQVWARDRLLAQNIARTVRVDERVFSGSWSTADDTARSRVIGRGEVPYADLLTYVRNLAWERTSATEYSENGRYEKFLEAPEGMEWGPISTNFNRLGEDQARLPSGSWFVGVVSNGEEQTEEWSHRTGVEYDVALQRLGHRTVKLIETISGLPPDSRLYTKSPKESTRLHPAYVNRAFPIIRAEWVSQWVDESWESDRLGPTWAPVLELDMGWWLTPTDAQATVDLIALEVCQPMVTMSGVSVLWDPTRQIGDLETWIATDSTGEEAWRADVLVSGYSEKWADGAPSQDVDVRVLSITDNNGQKTYQALSDAYTSYSEVGATNASYADVYASLPGRA